MVFAGVYPADGSDYEALCSAIERLTCNDASVSIAKESSGALGVGFRCGFTCLSVVQFYFQHVHIFESEMLLLALTVLGVRHL
jgi:translation elongation factor EF-4